MVLDPYNILQLNPDPSESIESISVCIRTSIDISRVHVHVILTAGPVVPGKVGSPAALEMLGNGVYALGRVAPKIAPGCWIAPNAAVVGNVVMQTGASVSAALTR